MLSLPHGRSRRASAQPVRGLCTAVPTLCLVLTLFGAPAPAAGTGPVLFDIPRDSAAAALLRFAQQANLPVLFPYDSISELTANPLHGEYPVREALRILLAGTGLQAELDPRGHLIVEMAASDEAAAGTGGATGPDLIEPEPLPGGTEAVDRPSEPVVEEILITGSRIRRASGMDTPTPVTLIEAAELRAFAPGNLIDALNLMPQFLNNSYPGNVFSFSGAAGASFLNLRGVGSNRTLVLLDGRRVTSANRLGVPDINTFPEAMISGVELVTGGASAAYGSDAVSGVVNFRLDTEFTGVEGHAQAGITDRGDNGNREFSLAGGMPVGQRAHLIAAIEYFRANAVESVADRSWYRGWAPVDVNGSGQPGVILPDVRSRLYTAGGLIRQPGSALDMLHFVEGGVAVPFVDGDTVGATRQSGGTGYLPDKGNKYEDGTGQGSLYPHTSRGSLFGHLKIDLGGGWDGFVQTVQGRNRVNFNAMGAHQEGPDYQATIYRDNAFLPEGIGALMDAEGLESFRLSRYAPRSPRDLSQARGVQDNQLNSYTAGLDGVAGGWHVSGYYQFGRTRSTFEARRFPRTDRLYRATDAVPHPATGQPVCNSSLSNPDDGCVPLNIFGPYAPSAEAIEYVLGTDLSRVSRVRQHFTELVVDGTLHPGWGAGPVSLAAGMSFRRDTFAQRQAGEDLSSLSVPTAESQGYRGLPDVFVGAPVLQFAGSDAEPIGGGFDVWEGFTEALVPITGGLPGVQALDLGLAMRHAHYSGSGGVNAWKAGLDWQVSDALRFRATRSRDTRAGTLAERFDQSFGGSSVNDPVSGDSYSIGGVSGGNPLIEPELSDTWTAGLVLRPGFANGMALSVDWFDVRIRDYIALLGAQTIVNDCHAGAAQLCELISRDADSGRITFVEDVYLNVAAARVTGVDLELGYGTEVRLFGGRESLALRLFGSHLLEHSFTNHGANRQDQAGTPNLPRWTGTGALTYRNGPFAGTVTGRFIHNRVLYNPPVSPAAQVDDARVASVFYTNVRLSWLMESASAGDFDLFLNVGNVFDRDPPRVANWNHFFGASVFPPGVHDLLGRRYTAGVRWRFD